MFFAFACVTACDPAENSTADLCAGANGWEDTECLTRMSEDCRALTTEADCWAASQVSTASVDLGCGWTRVAVVEDATTCGLGEVFGRCEAAYYGSPGLGGDPPDGCQEDGTPNIDGFHVFTKEQSLVDIRMTPDGSQYPMATGPWVDGTPTEVGGTTATCFDGQDSPAICACAAQACAAQAQL